MPLNSSSHSIFWSFVRGLLGGTQVLDENKMDVSK
jgi:hypothetical protein